MGVLMFNTTLALRLCFLWLTWHQFKKYLRLSTSWTAQFSARAFFPGLKYFFMISNNRCFQYIIFFHSQIYTQQMLKLYPHYTSYVCGNFHFRLSDCPT